MSAIARCPTCGGELGELPPEAQLRWETAQEIRVCPEGHFWEVMEQPLTYPFRPTVVAAASDTCSRCGRTLPRDALVQVDREQLRLCRSCRPQWEQEVEEAMQSWQPDPGATTAEITVKEGIQHGEPVYVIAAAMFASPPPPDPRVVAGWAAVRCARSREEAEAIAADLRGAMHLVTSRGITVRERWEVTPGQLSLLPTSTGKEAQP